MAARIAQLSLFGVALIIGIARGITVIMNNGQITDTVLSWVESALGDTDVLATCPPKLYSREAR